MPKRTRLLHLLLPVCVVVGAGAPILVCMCGGGRCANHVASAATHVWWVDGPPTTLCDASLVTAIWADSTSLFCLERACMCLPTSHACHTIHPHSMGAFMHYRGGCMTRGAWHLHGRGGCLMLSSCWHPLAWICAEGAKCSDGVAYVAPLSMHVRLCDGCRALSSNCGPWHAYVVGA